MGFKTKGKRQMTWKLGHRFFLTVGDVMVSMNLFLLFVSGERQSAQ